MNNISDGLELAVEAGLSKRRHTRSGGAKLAERLPMSRVVTSV